MGHAVVNHSVFIDECGYNSWMARSHGRVRRGERTYNQVCGQRGRNVTVTMAISPTNSLVFELFFCKKNTSFRRVEYVMDGSMDESVSESVSQ